jgi:hypothetical protein
LKFVYKTVVEQSLPLPIKITVSSTLRLALHRLEGPLKLQHLSVHPCSLGLDDGLLVATINALQAIRPRRLGEMTMQTNDYWEAMAKADPNTIPPEPSLMKITISTDSTRLIEGANFLADLVVDHMPDGLAHDLAKQIQRFDVRWTLLQTDLTETESLRHWADSVYPESCGIRKQGTAALQSLQLGLDGVQAAAA